MKEVSRLIVRWLEQKRRTDRASAMVVALLALGGGVVVWLGMACPIFLLLNTLCGGAILSVELLGLIALGLSAGIFAWVIKSRRENWEVTLDPMGFWMFKDLLSIGPRMLLEGLRQARRHALLGELNIAACAHALAFLAEENRAVTWQKLMEHCPQITWPRLREQLSLLEGVLFLGEDAARVTLMDPFRLRLRAMLDREPRVRRTEPAPAPAPEPSPVFEPEMLSPYEILGLLPSASAAQIKAAYRKRVKECHPDLFANMDDRAKAMAEKWTRALNEAYATLSPRSGDARRSTTARS